MAKADMEAADRPASGPDSTAPDAGALQSGSQPVPAREAILPGSAPPAPGTVWRVRAGFVDLFAQAIEAATGAEGRPMHILRVGPDGLLAGLPRPAVEAGFRLLAVASLDAEIAVVPTRDMLNEPEGRALFSAWFASLAAFAGEADETEPPPAAAEPTPFRDADPAELTRILGHLHERALEGIALRLTRQTALGRERLALRGGADRQRFSEALLSLGSVFQGSVAPEDRTEGARDDPCLVVVERVLAILGRDRRAAVPVPALADEVPIDRVERLAAAAHLRCRRILLVGFWWRHDRGLLIGFGADGAQDPVVLRPAERGGYDLIRPKGETRAVSGHVGEALRIDALQVYRSFLPGIVDAGQILALCRGVIVPNGLTLLLMGVLTGALALAPPLAIEVLFDTVLPHAERGTLLDLVIGVGVAAIGMASFELTKAIALIRLENGISLSFQAALLDRLLRLPVSFFAGYASGDLVDRMLGVTEIRRALAGQGVALVVDLLFSGFSLTLLFAIDPVLAVLATGLLALTLLVVVGLNLGALRHEAAAIRERGALDGLTVQLALGIGKLRVAAAERRAMGAWMRIFARQQRQLRAAQSFRVGLQVTASAIPTVGLIVLFAGAATLGDDGRTALSSGSFMAFNAAFGALLGVILAGSTQIIEVLRSIPLYRRVRPLLTAATEPAQADGKVVTITGAIDLHNIRFRYTEDGPWALDGLSLAVRSGEYLAIVGPSGSGKSTLFRLLLGFERARSGTILFDGVPQDQLDLTMLRRSMGVVLQQTRISPGNVFQNIVGSSGLGLDEAWHAARIAGLAEDIEALPMGMHTTMMEGGQGLSGGQRQRLLIARALVNRPRIVLFDEATSALDNRTQSIVTETVAGLQATRIVIAHRLSTIERADRIAVLDRGRLVQVGGFADLMREAGPFRDLTRRQLL